MSTEVKQVSSLTKYLSPLGAWALSFGCSVGWGSFVMPGTVFLPVSGPLGTLIGITIGAILMFIIGINYAYLMRRFPDDGGTYTYTKQAFGYDHGFLSSWFLTLTYIAVIWANATAITLICRFVFGDLFSFGFHYSIAGFDVYLGEALVSCAALIIVCAICLLGKRIAAFVQIAAALVLFIGIITAFILVFSKSGASISTFTPAFSTGKNKATQVFAIIALAPWAFVGFESVSHSTEEYKFKVKKTLPIILISLITGALAYITLTELAVTVLPEGYSDWTQYIADLDNLDGPKGLPTFNAVKSVLGRNGLILFTVTTLSAIITGLIGNMVAASRLLFSMSKDNMLPSWFSVLNRDRSPKNAIMFISAVSLIIPFFGRTAIGWIVDVTTIGATIAYAYTSASAIKLAKASGRKLVVFTGVFGLIVSVLFALYLLVPNFWSVSTLATESYFIIAFWSVLGIIFFRYLFSKDTAKRLGKSMVVWIALLFLIFFTSLMWMRQSSANASQKIADAVMTHHQNELEEYGISQTGEDIKETDEYLESSLQSATRPLLNNSLVQMGIVGIALLLMFNLYSGMQKRERQMEVEKIIAEKNSRAKTSFLSNMSHDIRTPMNAITGYTELAKREKDIPPKISEYLTKIDTSSRHLLSLINDVLDMSRIESGKMELALEDHNICRIFDDVYNIFYTQMNEKGITYTVNTKDVTDKYVICDESRINRVLLNLVSNAFKFTESGGKVSVELRQIGNSDGKAVFIITVSDTGIGMSEEFAAHVFDAFEREKDNKVNKIQGTGLGMSITKSFVELMGGTISVKTKKGEGTTFTLGLTFDISNATEDPDKEETDENCDIDFSKTRLLLTEDNMINREIALLLLGEMGFVIDTAENGKEALETVSAKEAGYYAAVLMDIQMPVMNGYEATRAIRALPDKAKANVPIIAMTANAFTEDIKNALDCGMNAYITKPIEMNKMKSTLISVLSGEKNK